METHAARFHKDSNSSHSVKLDESVDNLKES